MLKSPREGFLSQPLCTLDTHWEKNLVLPFLSCLASRHPKVNMGQGTLFSIPSYVGNTSVHRRLGTIAIIPDSAVYHQGKTWTEDPSPHKNWILHRLPMEVKLKYRYFCSRPFIKWAISNFPGNTLVKNLCEWKKVLITIVNVKSPTSDNLYFRKNILWKESTHRVVQSIPPIPQKGNRGIRIMSIHKLKVTGAPWHRVTTVYPRWVQWESTVDSLVETRVLELDQSS